MLQSHINAIEQVLLAQSVAAQNAGHPNLRGGPREWFIRDFLATHLPSTLDIGQGEIIDLNSVPSPPKGSYRPQVDIVLYRRDMPKIYYSRTDSAYLVEGVLATIESKSVLTKEDLINACKATNAIKSLQRKGYTGMAVGWIPPHVVSYVVAFDGPAKMNTVAGWLPNISSTLGAPSHQLVVMVVVLGKGVLWQLKSFPQLNVKTSMPSHEWAYVDQNDKNLLTLFLHLLMYVTSASTPPQVAGYASKTTFSSVQTC